ncbi:MAG: tetratricopeptide repeat protein, partial [Pseudomonadota bacterium]
HTVLARAAAAEGDYETAISHMEEAVALQEGFPYTEPPYWYYPAKQTLAAMVLRAGDGERAEQLFTETLVYSPNNAYAYYGLAEAHRAQGDRRAGRYAKRLYRDAWLGGREYRPSVERL